jgi:hypothetical protein
LRGLALGCRFAEPLNSRVNELGRPWGCPRPELIVGQIFDFEVFAGCWAMTLPLSRQRIRKSAVRRSPVRPPDSLQAAHGRRLSDDRGGVTLIIIQDDRCTVIATFRDHERRQSNWTRGSRALSSTERVSSLPLPSLGYDGGHRDLACWARGASTSLWQLQRQIRGVRHRRIAAICGTSGFVERCACSGSRAET